MRQSVGSVNGKLDKLGKKNGRAFNARLSLYLCGSFLSFLANARLSLYLCGSFLSFLALAYHAQISI
jgi:hypothetical protein